MRGVRNVYHHSYIFSFIFVLVRLILLPSAFSIYVNTLSSTESLTISNNRSVVSPGGVFELGFFKAASSCRWYLGIRYKKLSDGTYVWVANRDNPISTSIGTLKISEANLVLLDYFNTTVWSTNLTGGDVRSPMVAELLANGNFVLKYSNNSHLPGFLWQSFDFPTDTLLPQMKMGLDLKTGLNKFLTSWKSPDDPSTGDYVYKLETRGSPEFFLWQKEFPVYRSGPWDGIRFNGMFEMRETNCMVYNFTENEKEVAYTFLMTNYSIYSRLIISPLGYLQQFTWTPSEPDWKLTWISPKDQCDMYQNCGPYSYCDTLASPVCNCIRGFKPMILQEKELKDGWGGCVRKTRLSCGRDAFLQLSNMKLPDTTWATVDERINLKECEERCLKDCNCTAFANSNVRNGSGCMIWTRNLVDIRKYVVAGQDLFVKLAAADLG